MDTNQTNINYEDEIDLRQLIMALWNRKIMIIVVTLLFALVAGVFSKFFIKPVYSTRISIVANIPEIYVTKYGEYTLPIKENGEYINLIKSGDVVSKTIEDLGYSSEEMSVEKLSGMISEQSVFNITVSADNPEESLKIANQLYDNYIRFVEIMLKEKAVNYYYNDFELKLKMNQDKLLSMQDLLSRTEELLKDTPKIINQKEAIDEIKSDIKDFIILENIINPNYTQIESDIIETKQNIYMLESTNAEYAKYLEELAIEKEGLTDAYKSGKDSDITSLVDNMSVSIYKLSDPVAPSSKSSPNVGRNVVIGGLVGGMLSVFVALFLAYWKKEI